MHPTYKHLEDCIRLGGLSLSQWAQLTVCALAAYALSRVLPLPGSWSVSVAVTLCGLPAAAAMAAMQHDFDLVVWARAAARFARSPRVYVGSQPQAVDVGDWSWLWEASAGRSGRVRLPVHARIGRFFFRPSAPR